MLSLFLTHGKTFPGKRLVPGKNRTFNFQSRNLTLYPIELQAPVIDRVSHFCFPQLIPTKVLLRNVSKTGCKPIDHHRSLNESIPQNNYQATDIGSPTQSIAFNCYSFNWNIAKKETFFSLLLLSTSVGTFRLVAASLERSRKRN